LLFANVEKDDRRGGRDIAMGKWDGRGNLEEIDWKWNEKEGALCGKGGERKSLRISNSNAI
jgi:hypothetical protein